MRGLAIVVVVAISADALACYEPDLDDTASGGDATIVGEYAPKVFLRPVPAHPSFYFHRGTDDRTPPSTYVDEVGRLIPLVPIYTGIAEFPIRYDLGITRGMIFDTKYRHRAYVVDPEMVPRTRSVKASHWNGYLVIDMDTDAALLRVEEPDRTYVVAPMGHQVLYFRSEAIRITATYGDRREEMIYGAVTASSSGSRPSARDASVGDSDASRAVPPWAERGRSARLGA